MDLNLATLHEAGQVVMKSPGEFIFHEGDPGREMYVILSGKIHIYLERKSSKIPLAGLASGDFFGEMSLLEGMPRSGTAVVEEHTELLVLEEESFRQLMKNNNELPWKVMKGLSARIRNQNQELAQRIGHDLQDVSDLLDNHVTGFADEIQNIAYAAKEVEANGNELASHIKEIEGVSQQIGESLDFISQVAMKTKVLGLNASIEASRSGEYGRGFGVIAEEVRKLSELSKEKAEDIAHLTEQISLKMRKVTEASENSALKSQTQVVATSEMVEAMEEVTGLARRLTQIAGTL